MNEVVVSVKNFCKRYGDFLAVENISLDVHRGEIFGLLGPNGAGKTTTLESLEGIRRPDGGALSVFGFDPSRQARQLRNMVGVQLQASALPAAMTVSEAMKLFCAYHNVVPRFDLIERVGLREKLASQYQKLSVGQQRRLALALAISYQPKLLILDEPTAGLDVQSRIELHELMRELQETGVTIILATHDMAEAEKMADRVVIIANGKVIANGSPRELTARSGHSTKISVATELSLIVREKKSIPLCTPVKVSGEYAVYFTTNISTAVSALLNYIEQNGDRLVDLRVERPSLEESFLELTMEGVTQ